MAAVVKGVFGAHSSEHPLPSVRLAMVAMTVLSLAAGAHTLAGGELPSPGILLALLALTGLASTTATRLKLNLPALAGLLGAGQLVLHEAFTAFSGPALSPPWPAPCPDRATSRTTPGRVRSRPVLAARSRRRDWIPDRPC